MGAPGAKAHLHGKRGPDRKPRKGHPLSREALLEPGVACDENEIVARAKALALVVGGLTLRQAAEEMGVSRVTLDRWLRDPEIKRVVLEAEAASIEECRAILKSRASKVVKMLCDYADGTVKAPDGGAVRAAAEVLDRVGVVGVEKVEVEINDLRRKTDADLAAIVARGRPALVREGEA